jgi:nucleotide-binding universal stress UspA family protein
MMNMNIRTILHPTDFSEASAAARELATTLARDNGAKLLILNAWQPPAIIHCRAGAVPVADPDAVHRDAKTKLDAWEGADERLEVEGDPCEAILGVARERNCDLIVMGTHGRAGLDRMILGSVAEHVVRRAPCPVVTVRATATSSAAPVAASERATERRAEGGVLRRLRANGCEV